MFVRSLDVPSKSDYSVILSDVAQTHNSINLPALGFFFKFPLEGMVKTTSQITFGEPVERIM